MVLESLHHMLLPMLQWDKEGVQAASSEFPPHHYTSRQCTALETMLEILRVMKFTPLHHLKFTPLYHLLYIMLVLELEEVLPA